MTVIAGDPGLFEVELGEVPEGVRLVAGLTATVEVQPRTATPPVTP